MEGAHDLGGLGGFGPVVTPDGHLGSHERWELRAQALALFGFSGSVRPWIERIDPATYLASSYYERWLLAAERGAIETGVVEQEALDRWRAVFAADEAATPPVTVDDRLRQAVEHVMTHPDRMPPAAAPRFATGDRVVVRRLRDPARHHRCPRYVRGATGIVERVCGDEPIPGGAGRDDVAATYTVAFRSHDLWGPGDEPAFSVRVDLCEEYLEALDG